jgi:hypothetical protein
MNKFEFEVVNISTGEILAFHNSKEKAEAWAFAWSHGILFDAEKTQPEGGSAKILGWDKPNVLLVADDD